MIPVRLRALLGACLLVSACGSSPPVRPTPDAPGITCPADITLSSVTGAGQAVAFPLPSVTGGAPPTDVKCSPASGASFPLGSTGVTCGVTDSLSRQASCSFKVVLRGFSIGVTKYEAVGDSLTEGENGLPAQITSFVDTSNSYPVQLQLDFDTDFPNQGVLVINRGHSGDPVELTVSELPSLLSADRPDAVLVLSGYNNLLTGGCSAGDQVGGECESAIRGVEFGIRDCIRRIKESPLGIKYIYVSTLTPPGPYLGGVKDRRINANAIVEANAAIRQTVASEGATLVDGYGAFLGHEADYIEPDGLHPRPAGYKALADAFFAAITATIPQTPLFRGSDLDFLR